MKNTNLIITDEVTCKFTDLDPETRRLLVKQFEVEKPGAKYSAAVRLGRWNGKVSYFSVGGTSYINLLDAILPILDQRGYSVTLDDRRTHTTAFEFEPVKEDSFSHIMWPEGHQLAGQPIMFRDHQIEVIQKYFDNPQSIQSVPTGAGKTLITAALSSRVEKYGRSIIIVPNKSLVVQTEEDYRNLQLDVGVYFGDRKDTDCTHTICTWQSLAALIKSSRDSLSDYTIHDFLQGVVCVIVDEAHSGKGDVLKDMLTTVMHNIPLRWGLTGTMPKEPFDRLALLVGIGPLVNSLEAVALQEKGVLANCHINILQLVDGVEFRDYQSELKYLTTNENRLQFMAKIVSNLSQSGNTLVLVDRVATGKAITDMIPDAVFVSGKTKLADRKEEYNEIRDADNKVLVCTYGVAAVGINIPRIFNLVMIEPGKSFVRVIQTIGRGVRVAADKDFVDVWDITSDCKFAKRHLAQRKAYYKEQKYPFSVTKMEY